MNTLHTRYSVLQGANSRDLYTHTHTQVISEKPCYSEGFSPKNLVKGPSDSLRTTGLPVILSDSEESLTPSCHSGLDPESHRTWKILNQVQDDIKGRCPSYLSCHSGPDPESLTPSCHSRILPLCHSRIYCGNPVEWISGTSPNMTIRGTNPRMTMGTCHSLTNDSEEIRNLSPRCHSEGFSPKNLVTGPSRLFRTTEHGLSAAKNLTHNAQYGRTMVETISVLAIMGVLGVAAIAGFRGMIDKNMANAILEDAQVAYINLNSQKENVPTDWAEVSHNFKPVSEDLDFYGKRDPLGQDYIKVTGIEKGVCQKLLALEAEKKLSLYTENDEKFTTCSETNAMVFAFNGQYAPAECGSYGDCPIPEGAVEFEGICTSTGRCHACEKDFEIWDTVTATCECSETKGRECSDGSGNTWCCHKGAFCGKEPGVCIQECLINEEILCILDDQNYWCCADSMKCGRGQDELNKCSDGTCWIEYKQKENKVNEPCEQTLTFEEENQDCSVEFKNQEFTEDDTANTLIQAYDSCKNGRYCNLTQQADGSSITAKSKGVLKGTCSYMTIQALSGSYTMTLPAEQCPENQYCNITQYVNASNSTVPIGAKASGTLKGTCSLMSENALSNSYIFTEHKGCPENEYCSLKWQSKTGTNDASCTNLDAKTTGYIYGGCMPMKTEGTPSTCPYTS